MKDFNKKHEAIITGSLSYKGNTDGLIYGDDVESFNCVENVKIYNRVEIGYRTYAEHTVYLEKDFILDLAKHIQEIESITFYSKFNDDLPF